MSMTIADIAQVIESWAPTWTAWERDAVGLQVGDQRRTVSSVLVALDVTDPVIDEARRKKAELIVSHHPLLFHPARAISASTDVGRMILKLVASNIAVYSAHTNLDFTQHGVSFALAKKLGLTKVRFLSPLKGTRAKVVVFVPPTDVDRVAEAMAAAGAGVIGEYQSCTFRVHGTGTFRGSSETKPFIGKAGRLETTSEVRLEMIAPRARIEAIVAALKRVHPYEEVAYDVYPLDNEDPNYGMGAIGELPKRQTLKTFLQQTKRALKAEALRYTGDLQRLVKTIAVCGGSGSDLLPVALQADADVLVTADVRYHTFHAAGALALVDAGHWETEQVILEPLAERLRHAARERQDRLHVFVTRNSTNPTHYI
jgi:dinuclear metal center YbgI/SA1388 family protein